MAGTARDDIIIEFRRLGRSVKVSAIDPATFDEVSIVAPVTAARSDMTAAVLRKLAHVQAKIQAKAQAETAQAKATAGHRGAARHPGA